MSLTEEENWLDQEDLSELLWAQHDASTQEVLLPKGHAESKVRRCWVGPVIQADEPLAGSCESGTDGSL